MSIRRGKSQVDDLIAEGRASLERVGDGDWTPQDTLLSRALAVLAGVTAERAEAFAEVKEDDGVRRLLHRRLADVEARLANAPHDSSCMIDWAGEGDNVHHYPNAGTCDCWKAEL